MEFSDIPKAAAWGLVVATSIAVVGLLVVEALALRSARADRRRAASVDEVRP